MDETDAGTIGVGVLGVIAGIVAVVTAPIWLSILLGQKPKYCECGAELTPAGICPVCGCEY